MDTRAPDATPNHEAPLPGSAPDLAQAASAPRIRSDELLRGARELVIEHRGAEYRLLRTRNDRLILNK